MKSGGFGNAADGGNVSGRFGLVPDFYCHECRSVGVLVADTVAVAVNLRCLGVHKADTVSGMDIGVIKAVAVEEASPEEE